VKILHFVQDFGCGLPLRSRPQSASTSSATRCATTSIPDRASKLDCEDPSLRSGFRLRAPASLTPAKRLNFIGDAPRDYLDPRSSIEAGL
jgi:hypothetical protein